MTPQRVIVAGEAFSKFVQETTSFNVLGIEIVSPDDKLSFLVASRKLFKFSTHYEYTSPFKTIICFGRLSPKLTLFFTN